MYVYLYDVNICQIPHSIAVEYDFSPDRYQNKYVIKHLLVSGGTISDNWMNPSFPVPV